MSLDTLLKAALFLELEEQKARQQVKQVQHVTNKEPKLEPPPPAIIQNGTDIPALVIDESNDAKRRQREHHVPCVMRSGTREVHNKLEKHRRAHLKECFDMLKKQLPPQPDEKKTSNLSILHSALRYIQVLKRRERELEHEMERLAREKITAQQRLATLKKEFASQCDNIDFSALLPATAPTPIDETVTIRAAAAAAPPPLHHQASAEDIITATSAEHRVGAAGAGVGTPQNLQTVSVVPISQVGYSHQGLVVGLHKVALVSKSLTPLVSSPVTHIITAPSQLNGKVVPLVNAQYLVKPVVVVSTPSVASTISPRPS